jgi:hypothetical protein
MQSRSYLSISCFGWLYLPEDGGRTDLLYVGGLTAHCRHIPGNQQNHKSIVLVFRTERWVPNPDVLCLQGTAGNSLQRRAAATRPVLFEKAGRSAVESQNRLRTYGHPPLVTAGHILCNSWLAAFTRCSVVSQSSCWLLQGQERQKCVFGRSFEGIRAARDTVWYVSCCLQGALFAAVGERDLSFRYLKHLSVQSVVPVTCRVLSEMCTVAVPGRLARKMECTDFLKMSATSWAVKRCFRHSI